MSGASELLLRIASFATLMAVVLSALWAWRGRDRWGRAPRPLTVLGAGPYRRAPSREWAPRGAPLRVLVVGGLGVVWGALTTTVFAPSGLVFLLAPARPDPGREILLLLAGLGVFATATAGLVLGPTLLRTSRALLERAHDGEERALATATWSTLHHAMVLVSFTLFAVHQRDPALAVLVSLPCAFGLVHAWSLVHVARFVGRLPVDASDETPSAAL